ncbi:MAG: SGNH/GDSL hydrolase family protein [Magnetococcales bacterium]|nr:SGNH/GDSL hydrolase family protein [Magnetococcales bacterium]
MLASNRKIWQFGINILLIFLGLTIGYLSMEIIFLRLIIPHLSLAKQSRLPPGLRPLAQSSKNGLLPHHYIAVLGDSYANGNGDWLLSVLKDQGNPPYQSIHVLHEKSGRDVVSFGESGADSIYGLVTEPVQYDRYINHSWLLNLETPTLFIHYFYEGNDLNDNHERLKSFKRNDGELDNHKLYQPHVLDDFIKNKAMFYAGFFDDIAPPWSGWKLKYLTRNLFLFQFLCGGLDCLSGKKRDLPKLDRIKNLTNYSINKVLIGEKAVNLPDGMQGPGMELNDEEIRASAWLFERSLAALRSNYPNTPVIIAYIPSTITVYRVLSKHVIMQSYMDRGNSFPTPEIFARSDQLVAMIRDASERQGAIFADTRPVLRQAARKELIHGPKDWLHFNQRGYTVLGEEMAKLVKDLGF